MSSRPAFSGEIGGCRRCDFPRLWAAPDGALLGEDKAKSLAPPINNAGEAFLVIEQRLKAMDGQATDMEVLSINPFWYGMDRDLAEKIVSIQNEKLV